MNSNLPSDTKQQDAAEWLELVRERVARLRYGVIELVVHDDRVTQIQCTEKMRVPVTRDE